MKNDSCEANMKSILTGSKIESIKLTFSSGAAKSFAALLIKVTGKSISCGIKSRLDCLGKQRVQFKQESDPDVGE